MAKKFVLGDPLKRLEPNLPGCTISCDLVITTYSLTKLAGPVLLGKIIGQKGAEGHWGTNKVATAEHFLACWIALGIRQMGGHNQLFSSFQSHVKASIPSDPGFQNLELKRGSCVL